MEPWTEVHLYEKETLSLGMAAGTLDRLRADEHRYKQYQRLQLIHWLWSSSTAHQRLLSQGVDVIKVTLPKLTMANANYSTRVKAPDQTMQTSQEMRLND